MILLEYQGSRCPLPGAIIVWMHNMIKPSVITRLSDPKFNNLFIREALLKRIDTACEFPVIWICGPPGSGKTALIASHVETREKKAVWIKLTELEDDPSAFFDLMALAAQKYIPGNPTDIPKFSREHLQAADIFALHFFEFFFNRLNPGTSVIFDEYEKLSEKSAAHELIRAGFTVIPRHLNIIVISRSNPPKTLARFLANNMMDIISWKDLCLQPDEAVRFAEHRALGRFKPETIRRANNASDGWIFGLDLLLEGDPDTDASFSTEPLETPQRIFDYFAGKVIHRLDGTTLEFLLKSSVLPRMDPDMAQRISGIEQTREIITGLTRSNCFLQQFSHTALPLAYHGMFRNFLMRRAEQTYGPKKFSQLKQAAAGILEERQEHEEAAELYASIKDHESLVRLIMTHAPGILAGGREGTLLSWIRRLPAETAGQLPWIIFWNAAALLPTQPKESKGLFETSFSKFQDSGDTIGRLLSWTGIIDALIYSFESFRSFDPWIDKFETFCQDYHDCPLPEIKTRVAGCLFKALVLRHPGHPDIEQLALQGLSGSDAPEQAAHDAFVLCHLHGYYANFKADLAKAGNSLKKLQRMAEQPAVGPMIRILYWYAAVNHFEFSGNLPECRNIFNRFKAFEDSTGLRLFRVLMSGHMLGVQLDAADLNNGRKILAEIERETTDMKPWESWLYSLQKARLLCMENNIGKAAEWIEKAWRLSDEIGTPVGRLSCIPIKSLILHFSKETKKALTLLDQCLDDAERLESPKDIVMLKLVKAYIQFDTGRDENGLKTLQHALFSGKNKKLLNGFNDIPGITVFLCTKALENNIEPEYVKQVLLKRNLNVHRPSVYIRTWPWKFRLFSFGGFRIEKNGTPLAFSGKTQHRPLSVLKLTMAAGEQKIHENRIINSLWPETDGNKAKKNFFTTLHRLRKLLGCSEAVRLDDGYLSLSEDLFWVDAWAFSRLLKQAEHLLWDQSEIDDFNKMLLARKALLLYKGDFLPGEQWAPAVISTAKTFQDGYTQCIRIITRYYKKTGQWSEAFKVYDQALNQHFLSPRLCREMVISCKAVSGHQQALQLYQRCRKALARIGSGNLPVFDNLFSSK